MIGPVERLFLETAVAIIAIAALFQSLDEEPNNSQKVSWEQRKLNLYEIYFADTTTHDVIETVVGEYWEHMDGFTESGFKKGKPTPTGEPMYHRIIRKGN